MATHQLNYDSVVVSNIFLFSPRSFGKEEPILTNVFEKLSFSTSNFSIREFEGIFFSTKKINETTVKPCRWVM